MKTIIDDTDANNVYIWQSEYIWASESDNVWAIKKIVKSWNITRILTATDDTINNQTYQDFIYIWNDRASYTYN